MNKLEDILNLTREQIKNLSDVERVKVKAILEAEIQKIMQRNKK
jgi:hypothetical protein